MGIFKNGKSISAIYKGTTPIIKIYKGSQLVWQGIKNKIMVGLSPLKIISSGKNLINYKIYGMSSQVGTPTPTSPIDIASVGFLNEGKYVISVQVKNANLFQYKTPAATGAKVEKGLQYGAVVNGNDEYSPFFAPSGWFFSGTNDASGTPFKLKTNDVVTMSAYITVLSWGLPELGESIRFILMTRNSGGMITSINGDIPVTLNKRQIISRSFVIPSTYNGQLFYPVVAVNSHTVQIEKIQVEYGETSTTFVPYSADFETVKIYLDEPLRKLDDCADYLDFKNKKVVRYIAKGQINSSTSFAKFGGVTNYSAFYLNNSNLMSNTTSNSVINSKILSPTFSYRVCGTANTNSNWTNNYQIGSAISSSYKRICFTLPNTITDVASAKAWLADNPIDYYYIAETPTEESVDLPTIPTLENATTLVVNTVTQPSKFVVEYEV